MKVRATWGRAAVMCAMTLAYSLWAESASALDGAEQSGAQAPLSLNTTSAPPTPAVSNLPAPTQPHRSNGEESPGPSEARRPSSPDLETIARFAIEASKETTETVKWVFGIAAGVLGVLVGAASFLGYQSLSHAITSVKATANERAMAALAEVEEKAKEQLVAAEKRIQEHLEACNVVCISSLETVRSVTVGERWAETSAGRLATLREALQNAIAVQKAAEPIKGLERSYSWAVGMEAYICDKLSKHEDAIAAQLRSIQLAAPEKLQTEYHYKYNLACYFVNAGRLDEAVEPLREAIVTGGEEARLAAWAETDLARLRDSGAHSTRLREFLGSAPAPIEHQANG